MGAPWCSAQIAAHILFQNTMLEMGMIHVSQCTPYSAITPFAAFWAQVHECSEHTEHMEVDTVEVGHVQGLVCDIFPQLRFVTIRVHWEVNLKEKFKFSP